MNRFYIIVLTLLSPVLLFSQTGIPEKCPYKSPQIPDIRVVDEAPDFTITTTDGVTRNLYNTLDSGKTVFIDLFYTTCYYCQLYAPVIEEIYQETGAGQGDIEFWGISNNLFDTNNVIDEYKEQYNVSNPCAGPWGGGVTAFSVIVYGQDFNGFPTYCVICSDRTMIFDACYPPNNTCFDPFFEQCASISVEENGPVSAGQDHGILSVYPNPASEDFFIDLHLKPAGQFDLEIFDMTGKLILSHSFINKEDFQTVRVPAGDLKSGLYCIRLSGNNIPIGSHKLLITGR